MYDDVLYYVKSILQIQGPLTIPDISKYLAQRYYVVKSYEDLRAICIMAAKRRDLRIRNINGQVKYDVFRTN